MPILLTSKMATSDCSRDLITSVQYLYYVLTSLDPNKAVGLDEIGPRVLRSCAAVLTRPFHHLFSISIRYAVIPDRWKIHKVAIFPFLNLVIVVQLNVIVLYHY